jgi:hypothetical protein
VRLPAPDVVSAPSTVVRWGQGDHLFELRASDPQILARAAVVFRPWTAVAPARPAVMSWTLTSAPDGAGWHATTGSGDTFTIRGDANRAVTAIEFRAVRALLEEAPDVLTFHAALVARDSRGLLILGPNEAGKSTLACQLWRSGFALLGDDVALVDPETGEGRSAPRRVSLRTPSRELLGETFWSRVVAAPSSEGTIDGRVFHPDEVDDRLRPASARLAACIFLGRNGAVVGSGDTALVPPAQAALSLLPYSNLIRRLDTGTVIGRVAPFAAVVPAFDLGRGPLPQMTRAVERLLREEG